MFVFIPENVENIECNAIPEFVEPIAEDNCGSVDITFVETFDGMSVCNDDGFGIIRVWTATDRCGNTSTIKTLLWIEDDFREPNFIFFPEDGNLTCADFPYDPTVDMPIAIDNCSDVDITFEEDFSDGNPNDCEDGFEYRVTWIATDACGNRETRRQEFWVDAAGVELGMVRGEVYNENNQMIEDVEVQVNGSGISSMELTVEDGFYDFILPMNNNYEITPTRNDNPLNGISTMDLVLMSQHILGINTLDSPYKLIAADINNSGTITAFDLVELRKMILLTYTEFPDNPSWKFVDAEYIFQDPTNPFANTFPSVYNINGLSGEEIADFVGVKIGDLNGSAIPNQLLGADTRTEVEELVVNVEDTQMRIGEEFTIDFTAKDFNQMSGYQFTLDLDQNLVDFVDVKTAELPGLSIDNFGFAKLDDGIITTSWNNREGTTLADDAVIFSVVVKAKSTVNLSEVLAINSRYTNAEAYTSEMEVMDVALNFKSDNGTVTDQAFELYQNQPNPFNGQTLIGFTLPESTQGSITIYDVAGRVLKQYKGDYNKGYNEIVIQRSELSGVGLLYYRLETANNTATMKMIVQ